VNAVAGDWQVNGILSLHTGFALTTSAADASNTNSRGARPNCLSPVHNLGTHNAPASLGGGYEWFDPSAFGPADPGTFGTCGVGTLRGPGLATLDLSLSKFFPIKERARLEFRSEFINFTNTPILNSPNTGLGGSMGLLQGSGGSNGGNFGRQIQFAMKFHF